MTRLRKCMIYLEVILIAAFIAQLTTNWLAIFRYNSTDEERNRQLRRRPDADFRFESPGSKRSAALSFDKLGTIKSKVVRLAVCVRSVNDARQAAAMLKTVLCNRAVPLDLHVIVGSEQMFRTTSTLLNTWELSQVHFTIHRVPEDWTDKQRWPFVKYMLDEVLPVSIDQILYISNNVRLVHDVGALWASIFNNANNTPSGTILMVAPVVDLECSPIKSKLECNSHDLIGINLTGLRETTRRSSLSTKSSQDDVDVFLTSIKDRISTTINCGWTVHLESVHSALDITGCLPVKGVVVAPHYAGSNRFADVFGTQGSSINQDVVQFVKEKLSSCQSYHSKTSIADLTNPVASSSRDCGTFRQIARLKRRTHINFFVGPDDDDTTTKQTASSGSGVDVTLATQLTFNRFQSLERMLTNWDGPASVTLYLTDDEADQLTSMIGKSEALKDRRNIVYHVVYIRLIKTKHISRGARNSQRTKKRILESKPYITLYNPINYLRNVAVNNTHTTHVLVLDADFAPNAGIYRQLKTWIERLLADGRTTSEINKALIVPAFITDKVIDMPSNKTQLLKLMAKGTVTGYRKKKRTWNIGHSPTNFAHWIGANETYCVTYHDAFEPYLAVRMNTSPRFNELLLERYANKAMYVRALHADGFKLCVLPDVFLLHYPHEASKALQLQRDVARDYFRCASVIVNEYKTLMKSQHPKVKF